VSSRGRLSRRGRAGHWPQGAGLGLQGCPVPHSEASRVGLGEVHWSGCLCESPLQVFSWQSRICWIRSKGVDCRDPAGPRPVIPEVRTEAKL
jgi:hypothetical protein